MNEPGWMKQGVFFGTAFALLGVAFVLVSTMTDIERPTWLVLNQLKGALGFGLCAWAGFRVARSTGSVRAAAVAGLLAGAIGGLAVPLSMYGVAYGLMPHLRQYPFEYHDFMSSGLPTVQAFLLSPSGRAEVTSTTVELAPLVALLASVLGASVAATAGVVARKFWRDAAAV